MNNIKRQVYILGQKNATVRELIYRMRIKKIKKHMLSEARVEQCEQDAQLKKQVILKETNKHSDYFIKLRKKSEEIIRKFASELSEMSVKEEKDLIEDIIFCCIAYGIVPYEYMMFQFIKCDKDIRHTFLTELNRYEYYFRFNDPYDEQILFDKCAMAIAYEPFYQRDMLRIDEKCTLSDFEAFVKKNGEFVEKPIDLSRGEGVSLRRITDAECKEVFQQLQSKGNMIVEEKIEQADVMAGLHRESVNTIRCTTVLSKGAVTVFHPVLRVGRGNSFVDNASAGGIIANIDAKTGIVLTDGYDEAGNCYKVHPDTGATFKGFEVPRWKELISVADRIARVIPTIRFVGWDLALTAHGWVMIEGNCHGQFLCQYIDKVGRKEELRRLL